MRISEMLQAIATWLESPNNEALLLAEEDEKCAQVVAESCVLAAALIKKAAEEVEGMEPAEPSKITSESLDELAALAAAFDASGDPVLLKQASVLDELLLSIAAPPNAFSERMELQEDVVKDFKKKYEEPAEALHKLNAVETAEKAIDKSNMTKKYTVLEAPLSSRYCPDHPGAPIYRIGENLWQCDLDKKSYNFSTGFELHNGSKVPGSDVTNQTQVYETPYHTIFDTREDRLGYSR